MINCSPTPLYFVLELYEFSIDRILTNVEIKGFDVIMKKLYKNNIRINDISGCNRLLQRVVNGVLQDEITEDKARVLGYLVNIAIRGLQVGELEDRLNDLEDRIIKKVV